jgi:hypothetical protein
MTVNPVRKGNFTPAFPQLVPACRENRTWTARFIRLFMFLFNCLKIVMVALTSKGQIIDHFSGKMAASMATERIWSHRTVYFRSALFGHTWTDCLCPFNPCRSLLPIFISSSTRRFANSPGRASAEGQLIHINFFHQSNSIQLLVSSVIDSSHTRFGAWRRWGFVALYFIKVRNTAFVERLLAAVINA